MLPALTFCEKGTGSDRGVYMLHTFGFRTSKGTGDDVAHRPDFLSSERRTQYRQLTAMVIAWAKEE